MPDYIPQSPQYTPKDYTPKTIPQKEIDAQKKKVDDEGIVATGLTNQQTIDAQAEQFAMDHPSVSWIQNNWCKLLSGGIGAGLIAYFLKGC